MSDANFFWNRDKSFNLIKQINKLKKVVFFENLGSVYDKTQRLRKMAYFISDQLNINKEKIATSKDGMTVNNEKIEIYFKLVCAPFLFFLPV